MRIWIDKDGNEIAKPVSTKTAGVTDAQLELETGCRLIDAPDNRELWGNFDGTRITELTDVEYDAKVAAKAAQEAEREAQAQADMEAFDVQRQLNKPDSLKAVENDFLSICEQLTGSKTKLGFPELQSAVEMLMATNPNSATALSLKMLTLNAAGCRDGGLNWWDDIIWHEDLA